MAEISTAYNLMSDIYVHPYVESDLPIQYQKDKRPKVKKPEPPKVVQEETKYVPIVKEEKTNNSEEPVKQSVVQPYFDAKKLIENVSNDTLTGKITNIIKNSKEPEAFTNSNSNSCSIFDAKQIIMIILIITVALAINNLSKTFIKQFASYNTSANVPLIILFYTIIAILVLWIFASKNSSSSV